MFGGCGSALGALLGGGGLGSDDATLHRMVGEEALRRVDHYADALLIGWHHPLDIIDKELTFKEELQLEVDGWLDKVLD